MRDVFWGKFLPLRFFDLLLERFSSAVQRFALDDGRWQGHRTFLVDGSGCSMPDTPALQAAFGQPTEQRPGCSFPVARLLGLFHCSQTPCYLFQARDEERLPGLVDRWESYGIAAQVVQIPPTGGHHPATVLPHHPPATNR